MTMPAFHPVATGQAAQLVRAHQSPADLVFFAGWFCPYTQRVWIVLEDKGIPYQYREIDPHRKDEAFLKINPKGLVPCIQVNHQIVADSAVINAFLEDAYPERPPLLPADPADRAAAHRWVAFVNDTVVPSFVRLLRAQDSEPAAQDAARQAFVAALETIASQRRGRFFFGDDDDRFSLVDATLAPWMVRDFVARDHRGFDRATVPVYAAWAEAVEARPSVQNTSSDPERYLEFNQKFLRPDAAK